MMLKSALDHCKVDLKMVQNKLKGFQKLPKCGLLLNYCNHVIDMHLTFKSELLNSDFSRFPVNFVVLLLDIVEM